MHDADSEHDVRLAASLEIKVQRSDSASMSAEPPENNDLAMNCPLPALKPGHYGGNIERAKSNALGAEALNS